jgi:uncharacterized membrane protein YcaP (DUF421 family)
MTIDWTSLLIPNTPLLELILRGSLMYLLLLAALRMLVRRHVGSLSLMDLLLMVLIADAAQNAMSNEYRSLSEGLILCGTLIGWNFLLDWLAYRYPAIERLLEPPPLPVIKNGRFLRRNMRAEFFTPDELMSQLRQQQVQDVSEVKIAYVEPDGGLSVVRYDATSDEGQSKRKKKSSLR